MGDKKKVICMGMSAADVLINGIDLWVGGQSDLSAESIILETGGDALNQSIVLSKLGYEVTLMSMTGDDVFGELIRKQCKQYNINQRGLFKTKDYPTSVSVVCIRPDGERSFITHKNGTVNVYSLEEMNLQLINEDVKVLSVGSLGGSERLDGKSFQKIFMMAKENGTLIVADMVDNLGDRTISLLKESFAYIDYLIPSEEEMRRFTGYTSPQDGAAFFHSLGVANVIIKLGARGAYVSSKEFEGIIPSFKVKAIDTTGAGDNFMGGFTAGIMQEYDIWSCVKFASAVAAISVQEVGAAGLKNKEQVEKLLKENGVWI